jgi:hypothetical protein
MTSRCAGDESKVIGALGGAEATGAHTVPA